MTRILLVLAAAALAAAPAALADGVGLNVMQNGAGLLSADGNVRTVAIGTYDSTTTMLTKLSAGDGAVLWSTPISGAWGLPTLNGSEPEGLSADGKTLVLADPAVGYPRAHSRFLVLAAGSLREKLRISLKGDWTYDALSPKGDWLYLIQHTNSLDQSRYVVRRYDTISGQLLPGRVADRTQKSWIMQGYPVSRATATDGRWVYTLYSNPGGFPFVHALDTVRGVAHCVGLPYRGKDSGVYNLRLALRDGSLAVHWASGRPWYRMDTLTWKLSPDHRGGFPWWMPAAALVLLLAIGQRQHERVRAILRRAAVRHRPTVRLDDAARDGQPQAGAVGT